ncbi:hypothetical protein [Pseudomonas sp. Irchel 3E13]|uniref:hypothetical protein n=1 Tax=Pseudomonas sp. Irchel 3E13 TaxID=2008975 RepID=UPI0015ABE59A|nr:hypothetical protein [Pseudomonas sp. Irchel 3E13]
MESKQHQPHPVEAEGSGALQPKQSFSPSKPNQVFRRLPLTRQPGLGRYNATLEEWKRAYRHARMRRQQEPDSTSSGITWKAQLIITFERSVFLDPLEVPLRDRLAAKRLIDEIVGV